MPLVALIGWDTRRHWLDEARQADDEAMRAATAIATDAERRVQAANVLLTRTVRVIGAIQDVSERKWAELALADQQRTCWQ